MSNRLGIGGTVKIETQAGVQVRPIALARGYMSSSEPIAHFGLGSVERITRATVSWPSGHVQVFTDLEANRRITVHEPDEPVATTKTAKAHTQFVEVGKFAGLSFVAEEDSFDESALQPLLPRHVNRCGPAIALGDVNGDELDDVVLGGTTRTPPRILVADGQGYFRETTAKSDLHHPAINDGPALLFDADGDGDNDLLLTSGGVSAPRLSPNYQPRLFLNDAEGRFGPAAEITLPVYTWPVGAASAADFDRDGDLDLFLGGRVEPGRYPLPPGSAIWRNLGDRFEDVTEILAPQLRRCGMVTSALWTDVDNDGWLDLLLACEWGNVRVFANAAGERLVDRTAALGFSAAGTGFWSSLAASDFNGDGQPDYIAGNLGHNTPYRASGDKPLLLLRGLFEEGGDELTL
ncbi:MAG TPA: FG-GAP-like repeat-containing protein, partial [Opitutus sp.]|nr:FG-GAP-like repeat-containing protein [Opitutus sp.]